MPPEVQVGVHDYFDYCLEVDGTVKHFGFSDGLTPKGRIFKDICCQWVTETERDLYTHSHGLNVVVHNNIRICTLRAEDVPGGAYLYSNAFLDVDNEGYRIEIAVLEYGLWTLTLHMLGTN